MSTWQVHNVALKLQLSDWGLFQMSIYLQRRSIGLAEAGNPLVVAIPGEGQLVPGSQGFALQRLLVDEALPRLAWSGPFLRYVPLQYQRCYIDLSTSFEDYRKEFSSKTRSAINRKIGKYTEHMLRNATIVRGHALMGSFSGWTGKPLDRYGVKAKVRRLIRGHG